ncbi:prepilin-type N-terminal cleavage/methylation domain-containing protein [Pseudomonas oryzae]|uniref:MSHA pilin protein MshC n=1 Tax=Pseudomonas oryzae TaxID=1392877 RepID=A0A1H1WIN8_9PSED|nr:prepilin-type N-terminal cleavage/methylation domain-containing protein [Pseudomonas oryzae]SDS96540.1 MSHA pilin protein MshC [Pseudomonas oryzae]
MHSRGFTLVELILVIVIIGILAAVVGPRFFERQVFDDRLYAEGARAALRHAQKLALAGGCRIRFSLDASGYRLLRDADCDSSTSDFTAAVIDPASGQTPYIGSAPAGIGLTPAGGFSVIFDSLGRADTAVSASLGGHVLRVEAGTGLVR